MGGDFGGVGEEVVLDVGVELLPQVAIDTGLMFVRLVGALDHIVGIASPVLDDPLLRLSCFS